MFTALGARRPRSPPPAAASLRAVARNPLPSQRVSALIRWHGIRLWLRRLPVVPRRPHQAPERNGMTTTLDPRRRPPSSAPAARAPAYGVRGSVARAGRPADPARGPGHRAARRPVRCTAPRWPSAARCSRSPGPQAFFARLGQQPDDRPRRVLHGRRVERRRRHRPGRRAGAVRRAAHRPDPAGVLQAAARRAPPRPRTPRTPRTAPGRTSRRTTTCPTRCSSSSSTRRCPTPRRCSTRWTAAHAGRPRAGPAAQGRRDPRRRRRHRGSRVLEIGTGWGTLAIRAAERGATVTTVTLSVGAGRAGPAARRRRRCRRPGRDRGARLPRPGRPSSTPWSASR